MKPPKKQKPLSEIAAGTQVTLSSINIGRDLTTRLTSLGMTPGVLVEVMQNFGRGPLIVSVRGTRVALGRGEANKLMVEAKGLV